MYTLLSCVCIRKGELYQLDRQMVTEKFGMSFPVSELCVSCVSFQTIICS